MTWRALTYGTAVLASLTIGTAIYYSDSRILVKTEDITELLEAVSERQLALSTTITTQRMGYQQVQWADATPAATWDGTNLHNGYWSYDGTTSAVPTSYKVPAGESTYSNTFISTGQWFRAWVPVYTNVGRVRDIPNSQYTVAITEDGGEYAYMNGTYNWVTSLWTSAGVDSHVYANTDESVVLVATPQDKTYGWQLGALYWGSPLDWRDSIWWDVTGTLRSEQCGGSITEAHWPHPYYGSSHLIRVAVTASGSSLEGQTITNAVGQWSGPPWVYTVTTNINVIKPMEFPARSVTNIANAVQLLNYKAFIDSVDYVIGHGTGHEWPGGFIGSFVDMSQASNGTFDAYFAANTNATTFPKMTLRRAFEILGPTCGTNIPWAYGLTNAVWMTFPARGTNPPVYGGTMTHVTKEALTARFKVLQLCTATERTAAWWTGEQTVNGGDITCGYTNGYHTATGDGEPCDVEAKRLEAEAHVPYPNGDLIFTPVMTNCVTSTTGMPPSSASAVNLYVSPRASSMGHYPLRVDYCSSPEGVPYASDPENHTNWMNWYSSFQIMEYNGYQRATYTTRKASLKTTTRVDPALVSIVSSDFYLRETPSPTNGPASARTFKSSVSGSGVLSNAFITTDQVETWHNATNLASSFSYTAHINPDDSSSFHYCGVQWATGLNSWSTNPADAVMMYWGDYGWGYARQPHGEDYVVRYWDDVATNLVDNGYSLTAGPVLLKWDFQYCRP